MVTASSASAANGAFEASRRPDAQKVPLRHRGAVAYVVFEGLVPKTASISVEVGASDVARSAATRRRDAILSPASALSSLFFLEEVYSGYRERSIDVLLLRNPVSRVGSVVACRRDDAPKMTRC